jgi:hypothetical protein
MRVSGWQHEKTRHNVQSFNYEVFLARVRAVSLLNGVRRPRLDHENDSGVGASCSSHG